MPEKTPGLPPKLAAFCRGTKKIRSVCRASSQGVLFLDGPYVAGKLTTLNIFVWNFSPRTLGENVHTFLTSIFFILGVGFNHQLGKINEYHGPDFAG